MQSVIKNSLNAIKADVAAVNWKAALFIVINVLSSIGIVVVNKHVLNNCGFSYPTALTFIHFCFTFIGLWIAQRMKVFVVKPLELMKVLPLALSFCGFVVFTNLSLQYNSVGFYQVMKVLTTPFIAVIQRFYYGKRSPMDILYSLAMICVGVLITTYSDVTANVVGTFFAVIGVIVTSFYQIWVGSKQTELEANSMQLLYYQAPMSAAILVFFVPIFDYGFIEFEASVSSLAWIALSGVLSVFVNLSIFLLIGSTSAITYNVVGHFKLSFIVMSGFIFFGDIPSGQILLGIFITIIGVFWYTHLKLAAQKASTSAMNMTARPKTHSVHEVVTKGADDVLDDSDGSAVNGNSKSTSQDGKTTSI